jgi:hypothetical protein
MGSAWRIEFEGALYHVMSRGNECNDIFLEDKDRKEFLKALGEIGDLFGITYSSVSHSVKSTRLKLEKNGQLKNKFKCIYSLFEM